MYDPNLAEKVNRELKEEIEREDKRREFLQKGYKEFEKEIKNICKGYEKFKRMKMIDPNYIPTDITDKLNPTKAQITAFCNRLAEYKDLYNFNDTSKYLTALMHSSEDDNFLIDFTKLNEAGIVLDDVGYRLKNKKLTVYGNVGIAFGNHAEKSDIYVSGDTGNFAGNDAKNSEIYVYGDAGSSAGSGAKNSRIIIDGNAGNDIGVGAKDCKIYVKGTIDRLSDQIREGTKIHKGKRRGGWKQIYPE